MNRWLLARAQAYELRQQAEAVAGRELCGRELLDSIIARLPPIDCVPVPGNSPLLGSAEGGYDLARYYADEQLIVINRDLPDEATRNFYLAHEIGHHILHTRPAACGSTDMDTSQLVLTLPYAEGRVATYNARQLHENEATVFATELLAPANRLCTWFDEGQNASDLAQMLNIPPYAVMAQMATVLLAPTVDFTTLLATKEEAPFSWRQLDPSQQVACCALPGPVLVQAGPGTGKTRTLISRIEWLVNERAVPASRILALTFSNRATEELRVRLRRALPNVAHQVTISTFHGFGLELLRRYGQQAGFHDDAAVVDPVEAVSILEDHQAELGLAHFSDPARPGRYLDDILAEIARAKEDLKVPPAGGKVRGYLAIILPKTFFAQLAMLFVRQQRAEHFTTQFFFSREEALQWLKQYLTALPGQPAGD